MEATRASPNKAVRSTNLRRAAANGADQTEGVPHHIGSIILGSKILLLQKSPAQKLNGE